MMAIVRRGETEQSLQQPMHARRVKKILAAHDIGDALQRVVDDDREMIARRRVLARQNNIAPLLRQRRDVAEAKFAPSKGRLEAVIASRRRSNPGVARPLDCLAPARNDGYVIASAFAISSRSATPPVRKTSRIGGRGLFRQVPG